MTIKENIQQKELERRLLQLCDKAYNHYFYLVKELNVSKRIAIAEAEKLNTKEYFKQ